MISVRFLGTGGARFVVAKQIRASGGMWFRFGPDGPDDPGPVTQIHVDPGPGALVRALSAVPPCEPTQLDAIALSHKHLDHSCDVNAMIEAMTTGGYRRRGAILAPHDAFAGEAVILPYAAAFVPRHEVLGERAGPLEINDVTLRGTVRHRHGVETYGMHFRYRGTTVSYLPCSRYFEGLAEDYAAHRPDVLIVNVLQYEAAGNVDHLDFAQARRIFEIVRPRVGVMTHFGTKMLERRPDRLAARLEDELGMRAFAAVDGWTLDVSTEVAAARG